MWYTNGKRKLIVRSTYFTVTDKGSCPHCNVEILVVGQAMFNVNGLTNQLIYFSFLQLSTDNAYFECFIKN